MAASKKASKADKAAAEARQPVADEAKNDEMPALVKVRVISKVSVFYRGVRHRPGSVFVFHTEDGLSGFEGALAPVGKTDAAPANKDGSPRTLSELVRAEQAKVEKATKGMLS